VDHQCDRETDKFAMTIDASYDACYKELIIIFVHSYKILCVYRRLVSVFLMHRGGSRSGDWRGPYGERGARAYNGGMGALPPAGSRGRAPGQGVRGRSPPEAKRFLVLSYV